MVNSSVERHFQIGGFHFRLLCPKEFPVPSFFLLFQYRTDAFDFTYNITLSADVPGDFSSPVVFQRNNLVVSSMNGLETRLIGIQGQHGWYALYRETSASEAQIVVSESYLDYFHYDTIFTSILALERRMLEHGGIVLHSAYIVERGKAILFSAPSETGKSTQAALWQTYRGSYVANGDRSLLRKIDGTWHACGWPVCGSSGICQNRTSPLNTIVMLSQAKENSVLRLSPAAAFRKIYAQFTVNAWNTDSVIKASSLIEDLISTVPIWHLACNISEDAVCCLEHALYPEETL